MGVEEICNTGLSLGLGSVGHTQKNQLEIDHQQDKRSSYKSDNIFPSLLTLGLSSELTNQSDPTIQAAAEQPATLCRQVSSLSVVSSFSNSTSSTVKRERDVSGEEVEVEKLVVVSSSNKVDHDQDEEFGARKKLRLTKDQSLILEESFKEHSTLNPKQKQVLAKRLNLRARQVEVWFQNRRARTKLKQTEVDCEMLKKCCETLTEENRRLQKEVQELKALKNITSSTPPPLPFYMQVSAATITMCPSCERISTTNSTSSTVTETSSSKSPPAFSSNPHFNYTSSTTTTTTTLTHPSAPSYTTSLKTS